MQYVVKGKVFDDEKEAKKYEEELKAKEAEKEKKNAIKEQRLKELKELERKYVDKVNEFYKDYGFYTLDLSGLPSSFDRLFDDFGFNSIFRH